jgi:hypothetical protein
MRFTHLLCLLFLVCGICLAQSPDYDLNRDTNFSVGPQYLVTSGSPTFLRPIATPSLSFSSAPATAPEDETESAAAKEGLPAPPFTQFPDLLSVYYGAPPQSQPKASAAAEEQTGRVSEIEMSATTPPSSLPASIVNVGVTEMLDAQSLRERGYGVALADVALYWKAHKPHAPRLYTNADVERLHGG